MEQIPVKPCAKGRKRLFRLAAVGLIGTAWLGCEILLTICNPSWAQMQGDPLVGFSETKPLFELNQEKGAFQIRKDRLRAFVQNGFSAHKQPNTFRIFCLGGSTVQGRPYSIETSFTTWLRLNLETTFPDRQFEVINCGGVSYASYRLTPILKECLQHQPDLILLCTGNNEFLEDRSYAFTKKALPLLDPTLQFLSHSRVIRTALAIGEKRGQSSTTRTMLGSEVNAMLDYDRGIERYRRNESWRQSVEEHFEVNVERMIRLCRDADVPIMILSPCVNLKDSPPFKSQHRADLTSTQLKQWENHITEASKQLHSDHLDSAFDHLQQALQLDPKHAMTWYSAGQVLFLTGKFAQSKRYFEKALEEDICPLRLRSGMRTTLTTLAQAHKVPFYDIQKTALQTAPTGITGSEFLVDHVHPTISGHQTLGNELAIEIQNHWLTEKATNDMSEAIKERFQRHLNSLPDHYFANGLQRLQNLQAWTQGRADGSPIESLPLIKNGL